MTEGRGEGGREREGDAPCMFHSCGYRPIYLQRRQVRTEGAGGGVHRQSPGPQSRPKVGESENSNNTSKHMKHVLAGLCPIQRDIW